MNETLYDTEGNPIAYINWDDNNTIFYGMGFR